MFLPSTITLKFGDSGDFVTELQRRLSLVDCFSESMINSTYDGATVHAVTAFQGRHGIHADGVAGPETLRRLNGVIAGDTGGAPPSDTKPEETQVTTQRPVQQFTWGQAPADPFAQNLVTAAVDTVVSSAVPLEIPNPPSPVMPSQVTPTVPPPPPNPAGDDMLAALVQKPPAQMSGHMPEPVSQRPPLVSPTAGQSVTPPTPPAETVQNSPAPMEPEPQGLVGRAIKFANTMVQKLADYFESKLPPSVLREVQSIGVHMARQGVREIPFAAEPTPARAAELPSRGQEQAAQRV